MADLLERLQKWYLSQCNGDWEHTYGITISTIDNPGWLLEIDLDDTELASKAFDEINVQRVNTDDWVRCTIDGKKFRGSGGPENLGEVIAEFLRWAGQ